VNAGKPKLSRAIAKVLAKLKRAHRRPGGSEPVDALACGHWNTITIMDLSQSLPGHHKATVCPDCGTIEVWLEGHSTCFTLKTEEQLIAAGQGVCFKKRHE